MRKIKIAVDARTLGSRPSGVGMYLNDFLEQLINYDEFEWVLFTDVAKSEYIKRFEARGIRVISWGKPVKYFGKVYSAYFHINLKRTLKRTDMILYNSEQTKADTCMYFPEAAKIASCNAYIISNPLTRYVPPKDENYFLYVGNMEKRKGVDILVKAYREYRKTGGTRPLILAGKMQEADVGKLVEDALTELDGMTYLGYVSHTTRYDLYNNCSCFVFPSMAEGFGMPLLEVMKHNKPILASDLKIFDEVVGNCVERFSLDGGEEEQIKNLSQAMHNFDKKASAGIVDENAYKNALEKFTPDRLGGMVRDFINTQMENK